MADDAVIRLLQFRALGTAFDEVLRDAVIPRLCARRGIVDCVCGRQGPEQAGPRIIASVWPSEVTMRTALAEDAGDELGPEGEGSTGDHVVEVLPLRVAKRFVLDGPPRILRVLRGHVRRGEMDLYEQDMRDGTDVDAAGSTAHRSSDMAEVGPEELISLSTWRRWQDIEYATGGDIFQPRATQHRDRLIEWDVRHFEIIGND